jgi:hypothetical protein
MLSLLRGVQSLADRFGDWKCSADLTAGLDELAALQGKEYGEVALVSFKHLQFLSRSKAV